MADPDYRQRRDAIAAAALGLAAGRGSRGDIEYTVAETETWATAQQRCGALHVDLACRAYLDGAERLALPTDAVPQLADVSRRLQRLTGWRFHAAPGLAPIREFYGALAERRFLSTQYVRHPSVPLYTPEPDVIHELVGHANALADAAVRRPVRGRRCGRRRAGALDDETELQRFSRTFWFTLEFGVVHEDGELKAYGAGLLSSYGEIQEFRQAEIRDWDPDEMARTEYDIDVYQPVLFAAPSFDAMVADLTAWFDAIAR